MLMILEPLTLVFLTIVEGVSAITLALAFYVLTFVTISVLEDCDSFAVWL